MRLLFALGRWLLRFRYKIELINADELFKKGLNKTGKVLFLPNHPAEIDPIILFCYLGSTFRPHPLVVEHFFFLKGASFFMKLVGAIPIPSFGNSMSKWKMKRAEKAIQSILKKIDEGENFIIYPGGQLRKGDREVIGGNSLIHELISKSPQIRPVLIRTTGLWGSAFSRAITGQLPEFWKVLYKGICALLKNGIFFIPRRKLTIEFYVPDDFPKEASRLDVNRYLENWYNAYEDEKGNIIDHEPLKRVSYSFYKDIFPEMTSVQEEKKKKKNFEIADKNKILILSELSSLSGKPLKDLHEDLDLSGDLGLDSLDIAGLHAWLFEHFDIPKIRPGELKTVYDLFETAAGVKEPEEGAAEPFLPKKYWKKDLKRKKPEGPFGKTLQEAFLNMCDRMGTSDACGDELTEILSYKRLKLATGILAKKFCSLEGSHVGILLPSSVGAYLCIIGLLLARKTPVMLNWTIGRRSIEHCAERTNLQSVLTSMRFLDQMEGLDLGSVEEKLVLIEDIRKKVTLVDKLRGFFHSKRSAKALIGKWGLKNIDENDEAVILFTSGTETLPKGVPLTHANILKNQRDAVSCIPLNSHDLLLAALPPFHSFGFTVTGLLPLFIGLKVFYVPDPTDGNALARLTEKWHPTMLCLAPSFYKNLFRVAKPKQLDSVRLFVTGAEKAPKEMFDYVEKQGKNLIEGYGITECSPIVTLCRLDEPKIGVGRPLPHVELCIIHLENQQLIPSSEEGEVCIKGPGVFKGYLGPDMPYPFIELKGEKWYRSGDIGSIDEKGNLILKGRLKRFVKIGGEMVSLQAVEEELTDWIKKESGQKLPEDDKAFIAIAAKEEEGQKTTLVCISVLELPLDRLNEALRKRGFGAIVKISEMIKVDEIPLTGTGKVHYRVLGEMLNEKHVKTS